MSLLQSAMEHKSSFNKDEALIRMIALGITMKKENGTQFYCYRDGVFYVSTTVDFKEEILELHPGLKQEQFHEIMKYGFTRIKMIKMLGIKLKLSVRRHTINYTL